MSTPSEFLKDLIGNPVVVKLNSGVDYRGILNCLDGYMNIALEQTEEYVNGQLKKKYGDAFIRGNNVLYISKQKRNSGVDYRGILNCLDGYMNIALEQTKEYVNGQLKKKYDDAFIQVGAHLFI